MKNFILSQKVLTPNQFGYQSKKSKVDAVLDVIETISNSLSAKDDVALICFGLFKAFDTNDHSILLEKCYRYGFRTQCMDF